ncbi:MAG: hypothetical protein IJA72_03450 [Clostridia bacterium]|nr:hypothetical protein [Clostridia bacterium]
MFTGCSVLTSITFEDPNNWYRVNTATNWMNKTGGTSTVVIDSSANATYLISTYLSYYWYKL